MDTKKKSLKEDLSDSMACSAFAEAGEPCPIDTETGEKKNVKKAEKSGSAIKNVSDTMACTAFAEAGEPCPIDTEGKNK